MQPVHGGNLAWAAALAGCPPDAILDFSASINPLGPPKSAIAALVANLDNLSHYPDPNYWELRTALGKLHQLPPDWILPGNGSAELLTWAGWDLAKLAATLLITPAFSDYWRSLRAFAAKVQPCPMRIDKQGFDLSIPDEASKCGLLLNNPHNPSGKLFTRDQILPYLEQFALVVVDEAFMDFLPPNREQSLISQVEKYPNLVILRSLTKFYSLPGLRLGYAIAHPHRLQRWQTMRDPWAVNTLAEVAALATIQDTAFGQQTWEWLPGARKQLFEGLAQIPGLQPLESAANFLLVHSQHSTSQLQQSLLKDNQILIRDCLSFPELGDRYFRVAVRLENENERLIQAIKAIF